MCAHEIRKRGKLLLLVLLDKEIIDIGVHFRDKEFVTEKYIIISSMPTIFFHDQALASDRKRRHM
jgi:hypothetical protein